MDATSSTTMTGTMPTRRTAVWPRGVPTVGQAAERSRTIGPDDIDTFDIHDHIINTKHLYRKQPNTNRVPTLPDTYRHAATR